MMEREKRAKQLSIKKFFYCKHKHRRARTARKEESEVERVKVKRKSSPQIHFQQAISGRKNLPGIQFN
jgi:hypothetical protein